MSASLVLLVDRGGKPIAPPFETFPESPTVGANVPTHEVIERETLRTIAFDLYRDASLWLKLASVNGIIDPLEPLVPGQRILVPPLVTLLDWTG